jgi:tight adherence protein B
MKRSAALLAVIVVAAALAAAAAAASSDTTTMTPVARLKFPARGYLVGLPTSRQLTAADVVVRENGDKVSNVSFVPALNSNDRFAALLAIDASNSMRGKPLSDAFGAARRFAGRLAPSEPVGVLTFNNAPRLVQKPTSDASTLASTLKTPPPTAAGTKIYDALSRALDELDKTHASASSVVLLSDGADTGSAVSEKQLAARARRMRVRIFTVGLDSSSFNPAPLRKLAHDTGASYAQAASSGQLGAVYDALAQRLSTEYLLRYHSNAIPGANIVVTLQVAGAGSTTDAYQAPKKDTAVPPYKPSFFVRFWGSGFSLVLIALLGAALAAAAAILLLRRPVSGVVARIAEVATLAPRGSAQTPPAQKQAFSARVFGGPERSLAKTKWWTRFKEELEIAEIKYTAEQLLGVALVGMVLLGLLLYLIAPLLLIFGLLAPFGVYSWCRRELRKVRRAFEDQLPDNLQVLASALRAGHSFIGALSVVATDASEPSKREFSRVVADDEQLGVPLEDSLREVARRMDNRDLEQVALVAELQRQSGGNMAEVLDRVVETIRSRTDLRRLVRTLTAQGRMARWVLTSLPVGLALFLTIVNPHYMSPLFSSTGGQVALVFAGIMLVTGSYVIKRIVDIKV